MTQNDSRYPYTYACDLIRSVAGYNENGSKLSRSDASQIRQLFAKAQGIDDTQLANQLADFYLSHQQEIDNKCVTDFLRELKPL